MKKLAGWLDKIGEINVFKHFCTMARIEKNRVLWHTLIWGFTWFFLILFFNIDLEDPLRILYKGIPTLLGVLFLVAANIQWLLPKLYFKKRIGLYIIVSLALLIVLTWFLKNDLFIFSELSEKYNDFDFETFQERRKRGRSFLGLRFAIPLLFSFAGSTLIELAHYANKKDKAVISIEKEKLDTEIKFLKSQINPHFLFNALNNIYSLTIIKSEKAPDNLMRLSEMLRYMLYDSNDGKVPLQKEIYYLENYISLASLKDSRGLNINVDLDKSQTGLQIAPLLFIPFVENAFKHSKIEDLKNGFINIKLNTTNQHIEFTVENSIPNVVFKKDKVGGIGLANTKQRLNLLYPNKYELKILKNENIYAVYLKIDLE